MNQIIFRADDRLIHGQVVEGWIKNFHIPTVVIANDAVASDLVHQMIYQSVVPAKTQVHFYSVDRFIADWPDIQNLPAPIMVIFASISDLYRSRSLLTDEIYINIGCIASRVHCIEVSDTVFLEPEEMDKLEKLSSMWEIHIKKLPWEKDIFFCDNNRR